MPRARRTVLVLGGGVGGIAAARRLRRRLPATDRVVLVEREDAHVFQASLPWLVAGLRTPAAIRRPLDGLRAHGIEVVRGTVEAIDPATRRAQVDGRDYHGDALIVALGARTAPEQVPGLAQAGFDVYHPAGAAAAGRALASLRGGRLVLLTASPVYKCPAAPYEIALLADHLLRRRGVRRAVELSVMAAEAAPMATAGPAVADGVRRLLADRGIAYLPARQVRSADAPGRTLTFEGGAQAAFDELLFVPPHGAPDVVRAAGLTDASGWVPVDRGSLATRSDGVWAIGDVTTIPLAIGKPLPKAGVFAHAQAEVVADNVADAFAGRPARRRFDGRGACFVEVGRGRAAYGAGDFFAEPAPDVRLRPPRPWWHWGKVLLERWWLAGLS